MNYRIEQIANMIQEGTILADIGTDHGQLPIYLVKNGVISKAYACDVARGPLSSAEANIIQEGLQDKIQVVLSNGFENVPNDATSAVIAGMGYHTAIMILENAMNRLSNFKQIIVQVNGDVDLFRKWICDHQFRICNEKFIADKGFGYVAIHFDLQKGDVLTNEEFILGPILKNQNDEAYISYLKRRLASDEKILSLKPKTDPAYERIENERFIISNYLESISSN